jgi:hypothetical protein
VREWERLWRHDLKISNATQEASVDIIIDGPLPSNEDDDNGHRKWTIILALPLGAPVFLWIIALACILDSSELLEFLNPVII